MMSRLRGRKPFRGLVSWSWVAASLLVCGVGCGNSNGATNSNGGTGGGAALCVPGIQIACACSNGAKGAQACKADGSGFGACVCSSPAGGGSSSMGSGGQPTAGDTAAGAAGEEG